MPQFCPECSNLLRRQLIDNKPFLVCRCGYKIEDENAETRLERKVKKKKEALKKNLIIVTEEDKISVNPIIIKTCPKCGNEEAETWQEQTRSADEPSTHFFRCLKCRHTWREY